MSERSNFSLILEKKSCTGSKVKLELGHYLKINNGWEVCQQKMKLYLKKM
jgi:hypothetical protein